MRHIAIMPLIGRSTIPLALIGLLGIGLHSADSQTTTATTQLAVQIVPASSSGGFTPPAPAVAAGFTTLAFGNDFTLAIPNTAGTGLDSNTGDNTCTGGPPVNGHSCWLGCANPGGGTGDSYHHTWYQPVPDYYFSAPCTGTSPQSYVRQVTDPVYGNLVLDFAAGTNRDNGYFDSMVTMSTFASG